MALSRDSELEERCDEELRCPARLQAAVDDSYVAANSATWLLAIGSVTAVAGFVVYLAGAFPPEPSRGVAMVIGLASPASASPSEDDTGL